MAAIHAGRSKLVATKSAVAVNCDPPGEGGRVVGGRLGETPRPTGGPLGERALPSEAA